MNEQQQINEILMQFEIIGSKYQFKSKENQKKMSDVRMKILQIGEILKK